MNFNRNSFIFILRCNCMHLHSILREISTIEESVRNKKKILVFYASCFLRTSVSYLSFPFYRKRLILSDRSTFFFYWILIHVDWNTWYTLYPWKYFHTLEIFTILHSRILLICMHFFHQFRSFGLYKYYTLR